MTQFLHIRARGRSVRQTRGIHPISSDRFIHSIEQTGGAVIGDGDTNNAGLVFAENLADTIFLAPTSEGAIGRAYNFCDEETVTWGRYADDLARIAGKPPPRQPLGLLIQMAIETATPARLNGPKDASCQPLRA
jgi:nucleoside-diphosphate-sugar epimerase